MMSIETLFNRWQSQEQVTLDLSGSGDEIRLLLPVIQEWNSATITIDITSSPQWNNQEQNGFTVIGKASPALLGIDSANITLKALKIAEEIHFQIRVDTSSSWTFSTVFPTLSPSLFDFLIFHEPPFFILSTREISEEALKKGLNFRGDISVGTFPTLEQLVPELANTAVTAKGEIIKNEDIDQIILKSELPVQSFSIESLLTFQFDAPELILAIIISKNESFPTVFQRLECNVTLTGNNDHTPITLPLILSLPTPLTGWQIGLKSDEEVQLHDFLAFLSLLSSGGQYDLAGVFDEPSGILGPVKEVIQSFSLKNFYAGFSGDLSSGGQFQSLSFELVSNDTKWTIIEDLLELCELDLHLRVDKQGEGYQLAGHITGDIRVGGDLVINALIPLPPGEDEWTFYARQSVPLSSLDVFSSYINNASLYSLLPEVFSDLDQLELHEFLIRFDPQSREIVQLDFAVVNKSTWIILRDQLELTSLFLRFALSNRSGEWGLTGRVHSEISAGGIIIDTQILKPSEFSDWYFSLHVNEIPLPSLADLSNLTGGERILVDVLPGKLLSAQLFLDSAFLGFNLTQLELESFGFLLRTENLDFGTFQIKKAGLKVKIVFGISREVRVYGAFTLADVDFYLEGTHLPNGGWELTGNGAQLQAIPIGELSEKLGDHFGISKVFPSVLNGLEISDIDLSFNTKTEDFQFSFDLGLPLGNRTLNTQITLSLTHNNDQYVRNISGVTQIGDLTFNLILNETEEGEGSGTNTVLATYENASGKEESIGDLADFMTDNDTIGNIASGITFQLKDALLVRDTDATGTKTLLGLDVNGSLDLSSLPLIGSKLPSGANLRVAMQPVIASADFEASRLERIRPIVPGSGFKLPSEIKGGLGVNFQLFIGEEPIELFLDNILSEEDQKPTITQPEASSVASTNLETTVLPPTTDDIRWFSIQKNIGPVHFSRIGIQFHEGKFYFLLDVSITAADLTISLDGLYVSSALNPLQPQFGLHGLGINYQKDQVEVGGAFLRNTISQNSKTYDTYDGAAVIRTENFSLSALGAYSYYRGHPSLFAYAFSDTIVGGPPFFFVTGLAAGFGYNRRLVLPSVRDVPRFPLVAEAMAGTSDAADNLTAEIEKLHQYIPPATGESFLVIGVRFTSFKIIDSFALLSANLSDEFELNVVGLSTMIIPVGKGVHDGPLAVVRMALRAVYNPGRGYLKVRSSLTRSSYVLSKDCHLTGDFAFYSWFSGGQDRGARAGDFVLTMGGYHPHFRKPSHYPSIRPLAFNWKVNSHTTVKGRLYFALTPAMAMAGGNLEATWKSGSIKAWFEVGADFLISWKPYFYEASAHVRVGVSYTYHFFGTHHISTHVGADLTMWGPEFSGRAHVHLWIVSFTIHFGAHASREPKALDWEAFSSGFLPEREKWLNVSVTQGLVREIQPEGDATDTSSVFVVNPRKVVLETHAAIPITESTFEVVPEPDESEMEEDKDSIDPTAIVQTTDYQDVPIGSMKITDSIVSTHNIKISKVGQMDEVTKDFTITPVKKSVPAALWGKVFKQGRHHINQNALIDDACIGFRIEGAAPCPSNDPMDVSNYDLLNEIEYFQNKDFRILTPGEEELEDSWLHSSPNQLHVQETLESVTSSRNEFLAELGFEKNYYPNNSLLDEMIITTRNPS